MDEAGPKPVEEQQEAELDEPERCIHKHEGNDGAVREAAHLIMSVSVELYMGESISVELSASLQGRFVI